jgi:hypothetical protein
VLGATNRPTQIDRALLRPGRFDVLLYVPPPDLAGRIETLEVHTRQLPLDSMVSLQAVAESTHLFTGWSPSCLAWPCLFLLQAGMPCTQTGSHFLVHLVSPEQVRGPCLPATAFGKPLSGMAAFLPA